MRTFGWKLQKNSYLLSDEDIVNLMTKDHSTLKKCLTIFLVILGVGTTAYLLLNLSDDKVDKVHKVDHIMSGKPANEPADHNFVLQNPSYLWWCRNMVKAGVGVAMWEVAIGAIYKVITTYNQVEGNWLVAAKAVAGMVGGSLFGIRLSKLHTEFEEAHTAWFKSALKGDLKLIKSLFAQGKVAIDAQDNDGITALHWSAQEGHLACVKYLVAQGANINAKTKKGYTALMRSKSQGHSDCADYLIQQIAA